MAAEIPNKLRVGGAQNSSRPIGGFVAEMRKQFGNVEYRAVSADGLVVQSQNWRDLPPMREFPAKLGGPKK